MRWLVPLVGERFDTEELPHWFPDGGVFAVEENGRIFLTGSAFENLSGAKAVRDRAQRTLDEFAAVITLLSPKFEKPRIDTRRLHTVRVPLRRYSDAIRPHRDTAILWRCLRTIPILIDAAF